jgi:murein DD-endopeptidase MepM/ murein hydrolase activator NlpD
MGALRRSAIGPQVFAIAIIGLSAASCTDSGRFDSLFPDPTARPPETTGSISPNYSSGRVQSQPLPQPSPRVADNSQGIASQGISGGGRGMGSYDPGSGEVTGSVRPPPPPPPRWTWEGGTPVTVARGETLEALSRRYHVPVHAIMEANNITSPAMVHPGQHLVIPRRRGPVIESEAPRTRIATTAPAMPQATAPVAPPRAALAPGSDVHIVATGETLNSIARRYHKSVLVLARANNLPANAMLKVGERIVIPAMTAAALPQPLPRAEALPAVAANQNIASAESPHSARVVESMEQAGQKTPTGSVEAQNALPSFRWPARGRIIAGFGPKPNGLQNDGINLALPEGTPIKAAEDGVVAYAGNELKGYGNLVLLRHPDGYVTAYAHASEILVKRGEQVKRGQVIAKSGETGNVTSPQLHFEIRKGATPVDPAQYLNGA